jgi:putative hemolysin
MSLSLADFFESLKKPNYTFCIEKNNYVIKVADSKIEVEQALKLRNKVFSEVSSGFNGEIDFDSYDLKADHLIVLDKSKNLNVVGTYRFLLSDIVDTHYSAREFDLKNFLALKGRKLELGRASVDSDSRAGVIITLLWRGIAEYLKVTQADYLFGCSSMWNIDNQQIQQIIKVLRSKNLVSDIEVPPLEKNLPPYLSNSDIVIKSDSKSDSQFDEEAVFNLIPTLVKTYINVGSKFCIPPAYDPKLGTYEFFGFVETKSINPAFKKKYLD